LFIFRDVIH